MGEIVLSAVTKEFPLPAGGALRVLDEVTFKVEAGAFHSILGPSGCGKSTILNLIGGLDSPTAGEVRIDGTASTADRAPRPRIGFVFQRPRLLDWRSVTDNVLLPLEASGRVTNDQRDLAREYIHLVGLDGYEDYFPLRLSGGMQQRVALARALVINPNILLMDEPFSGLDEFTARKLRDELVRIWMETGKTILFVTHSISESVFLSQRTLIVSQKPARILKETAIDVPYPRTSGDVRLFEIERTLTREFVGMQSDG